MKIYYSSTVQDVEVSVIAEYHERTSYETAWDAAWIDLIKVYLPSDPKATDLSLMLGDEVLNRLCDEAFNNMENQ